MAKKKAVVPAPMPRIEGVHLTCYANPGNIRPVHSDTPFEGKAEFLAKLEAVEAVAPFDRARGMSVCTMCGDWSPFGEYMLGGWVWALAYRHGVLEHNVAPSDDFRDFIMGVNLAEVKKK